MEAHESALAEGLQAQIQEHFMRAAQIVLPPPLVKIWDLPKEAVRPCKSSATSADLQCHAPATAWCRLAKKPRVGDADGAPIRVVTVSEFGLTKEAEYCTPKDLAAAIIGALSDAARDMCADMRVNEIGCVFITSQLHMLRQRALGMLHCAACGMFCNGERGLRDHQHIKHTGEYGAAKEAVDKARAALVPYSDHPASALLGQLWADRVARRESAKAELSDGLRAARDGDMAAFERLVAGGWDPLRDVDRHGCGALHWAAGGGHLKICERLYELGMPVTDAQRKDGRTALHWAARNGHVHVCRWLVAKGVSPNVATHDGTVPLHWAVWQRQLATCEYLLEAGADLHAKNSFGCNASQWAAQTAEDSPSMCKWLQARGLDIGILNCNGHSALHKAAVKGNANICEWLLAGGRLGLRHLAPDGDGNTPALMARLDGHVRLAEDLDAAASRMIARGTAAGAGPLEHSADG